MQAIDEKMKKILIITFLLITGCSYNRETKTPNYAQIDSSDSENFNEFLTKFNEDSAFQVKSIRFPFTIESFELGNNGEDISVKKQIIKEEWKTINLEYKEEYKQREVDAYTQKIQVLKGTAVIEFRGIDNGIHFKYSFVKNNGQWVLVSMTDWSN